MNKAFATSAGIRMNRGESVAARRLDVEVSDHFTAYAEFRLSDAKSPPAAKGGHSHFRR